MAIINQSNILNLQPGITAPVVVHMSEGDSGTKLSFKLIDGTRAWVDPGNVAAAVHGRRQDGTQFGPYACSISGDVVSFETDAAMASAAGSAIAQIVLTDSDGNTAGSANFAIMVERATFVGGVTYTNDVSVYEAILSYVQTIPAQVTGDYTAKIRAEAAAREAADAEFDAEVTNIQTTLAEEISNRALQDDVLSARMDEFTRLPDGSLSTAADAELADVRVKADGTTAATAGDAVREQVGDLKSALTYKTDNVYGGTEAPTDTTLTNKKAWNGTSGNQQTSSARASSEQIDRTPDMLSIVCASGYSMTVYGNNSGAGNALTIIDTTWVSSVDLKNISYKYLFIVVKKSDGTNFGDGTTTGVISIKKGTEVLPYATKEYVDEKDSKKADARYTIADSQSATRNLTCNHGAFNATNGGSYSGSTSPKRGVVTPIYKENNYLKISAASGYLITVYGNDNGVGYSFDVISNNFEAEFSLENVTKKYIAVTLKKSDDADISAVDLSDKVILTYATTQAPYLTESEIKEVAGSGNWEGKKILWLGTSIPQQGYPQIVGSMLKAVVTNNAEGSSMMRIGLTAYDDSPLGDDLGITGMYHVNVLKSLSMTQEERKRLFLGWTTEQRKAYLISQGYSSAEVANVIGYSNMMSGSFIEEDTDPAGGGIPSQKPQDIWAGDGETYKDVRAYSYGCCWDDSVDIESDLGVTGKVTGTITGKLKSYVLTNDWIFFDHFRNDATDATSELMLTIPTDKYDRHYAIGAFNYLIQQIYLINPNANVLIVGHYDNDDRRVQLGHVWEAQEKAANLWAIPIYKLWEESGIRALTQFTTNGYWDSSHVWHNTGYDGTNNVMNNLEELNENKRQIDGVWYHDLSLRQKWMWDDVHPLTTDCKNHIAKLISTWLKKKESDMDVR